jgi:hypothetical protein
MMPEDAVGVHRRYPDQARACELLPGRSVQTGRDSAGAWSFQSPCFFRDRVTDELQRGPAPALPRAMIGRQHSARLPLQDAAGQQDERDQPHLAGKLIELEEAVTGEDLTRRTARIADKFDMVEGKPNPPVPPRRPGPQPSTHDSAANGGGCLNNAKRRAGGL